MTKWIKCSERLPNHSQWVLAFNGHNMCICWVDISSYDYLFMCGMHGQQQFKNVTHGQPLPRPPEDE